MKKTFVYIVVIFLSRNSFAQQPAVPDYFQIRNEWRAKLEEENLQPSSSQEEGENAFTQLKRWEWFWEPRVGPSGKMINPAWLDLKEEMKLDSIMQLRSATSGNWISVGPNHVTCGGSLDCVNPGIGRVNCLAFNGSDIYAGTASGGAWKYDGAWHSLTDCIPNLTVSGLCVDYNNPDNIYLLTGDGGNSNGPDGISGAGANSMGVLKSYDGGVSWNLTGLSFNIANTNFLASKMIMHPTNPSQLLVISNQGIHKTINGGDSWNLKKSAGPNEMFNDIEFQPGNPAVMYAVSNVGFYRSTDTGDSWGMISLPFPVTPTDFTAMAIGVSAASSSTVYLLVAKQSMGYFGLFKSTDGGQTFGASPLSTTPNVVADEPSGTRWQIGYDLICAVDPTNINNVYTGGIDLYKSTDGGATFSQFSDWNNVIPGSAHADQHAFEFSPSNEIYTGTDGGVYHYSGGWNSMFDNMDITQLRGVGLDPTAAFTNTLTGGQDNGEMVYDGDDNYQTVWTGDGGDAMVDFTDHDRYYFDGNGQLWKQSCGFCVLGGISPYTGCGCHDDSIGIAGSDFTPAPMLMDPFNNSELFVGYTCMFISTNQGGTWSLVPGLPCGGAVYVGYAKGVTYDWAAKTNKIFHQSFLGGWADRTPPLFLDSVYITHIIVSPLNDQTAWFTLSGYMAGQKVYETIDGGLTWTNISGSLPNVPVNCIVRQNGANDGVYAGTDIGVYYRDNVIGDWIPFRNGMPSTIVTDLEISGVDNNIYASTFGRGLWKSATVVTCENDIVLGPSNALPAFSSYQAANSITSTEVASSGTGQSVNYTAASLVDLLPGFQCINGSTLHASIGTCSNVSPRLASLSGYLNGSGINDNGSAIHHSTMPAIRASVYPNPFSDYTVLHLFMPDSSKIQAFITDVNGNVVYTFPFDKLNSGDSSYTWSDPLIPDGIYLLVIKSKSGMMVSKMVKI